MTSGALMYIAGELCHYRDYFGVVLVDEGHHAVARIWATVLDYFASAAKVQYSRDSIKPLVFMGVSQFLQQLHNPVLLLYQPAVSVHR